MSVISGKVQAAKNSEQLEKEDEMLPAPNHEHDDRHTDIKPSKGDKVLDVFITAVLVLISLITLYPLYIVVIASVSDPSAIASGQVYLIPKGLNVEAYKILLNTKEIWIGYRNSLFYTVVGTFLQMIITTSAGFALSRKILPGRRFLCLFFLFTMYFSGGLIPTYFVVKDMGLVNTVWALIVPTLVGPYNLVISRTYFENSIPEEIYESAVIDGASTIRYYWQFAIPLAVPVLAVMVLNFALGHWNSYYNALIYISDDNIQTLQVFIKRITTQASSALESANGDVDIEELIRATRQKQLLKYAVVVVSSVPMIALYPFIQRYFIRGIMIGAVKG